MGLFCLGLRQDFGGLERKFNINALFKTFNKNWIPTFKPRSTNQLIGTTLSFLGFSTKHNRIPSGTGSSERSKLEGFSQRTTSSLIDKRTGRMGTWSLGDSTLDSSTYAAIKRTTQISTKLFQRDFRFASAGSPEKTIKRD